jgi:adenylylsulfate kinase
MKQSSIIKTHLSVITRKHREHLNGHRGVVVWFTGLSGSGKSTLANAVEQLLHKEGCRTFVLDGDDLRQGLCKDLIFSDQDREENVRRVGEVAKLFIDAGVIVLTAFISPYQIDRERVRTMVDRDSFIEVYCDASLQVCEKRDVKGLYRKARSGEIRDFTGISSPYQKPLKPELILNTTLSVESCTEQIVKELVKRGIIHPTI